MPRHTLYVYVDGFDLDELAGLLVHQFDIFVQRSKWRVNRPRVVNQRQAASDKVGNPDDLPPWDLGLNLDLPERGYEPAGWFTDVEKIVDFLALLHFATKRDFVIGIRDNTTRISDDLFFVDSSRPDLETLRKIVGVQDPG